MVSSNELKLATGVKAESAEGPCGPKSGILLRKNDGGIGGYMACGCIGATQGGCRTENDNPEHPSVAAVARTVRGIRMGVVCSGPSSAPRGILPESISAAPHSDVVEG